MLVNTLRKFVVSICAVVAVVVALGFVSVSYLLWGSLPVMDGNMKMAGLSAAARVEFDSFGIPRIQAHSREEAFRILGFVTARDRLFQMDLLRRKMAGRLAEILGSEVLASDRWHRTMGFTGVSSAILVSLPDDQRKILESYSEGVNRAMADLDVLPFEFLMLGYSPEPWQAEDSVLSVLAMYTTLAWQGDTERATTVMRAALPEKVLDFFLPRTDAYTEAVLSGKALQTAALLLPAGELAQVLRDKSLASERSDLIGDGMPKRGSNAWVVAPSKTAGKRALLANDMHLELAVPNVWYRAELHYGDTHIAGLTLPGVPLVVSGSNHRIAWGFTASGADVSDLILLNVDTQNPAEYRIPGGSLRFGERIETIRIRGEADESLVVQTTKWGPVLSEPLLGKPVAVRWTALDPMATNLDYLNLDRTVSVQDALPVLNKAGGPPLDAFVADAQGNIAWTMTGGIPQRFGTDGLYAYSSVGGEPMWRNYISPEALPREVNPPSGFLISANQRRVGSDYPYAIGQYNWRGYRAYQIAERLRELQDATEGDLLALQLDTRAGFYRYYQNLALEVLETEEYQSRTDITELRRHLRAWNGQAELDSLGLGLLVEFREELMEAILAPYFSRCRELDPKFAYFWNYSDVPLQRLLDAKLPELLPGAEKYPDRNAFISDILRRSAKKLMKRYQVNDLEELTWGRINEAQIRHPLSAAVPWFSYFLDMPKNALPGCDECPRSFFREGGSSARLVVAPGHDEKGILHMPAGQSGHPLSPHYRDQHQRWVQGSPTPLGAGPTQHRLSFEPGAASQQEAQRP